MVFGIFVIVDLLVDGDVVLGGGGCVTLRRVRARVWGCVFLLNLTHLVFPSLCDGRHTHHQGKHLQSYFTLQGIIYLGSSFAVS